MMAVIKGKAPVRKSTSTVRYTFRVPPPPQAYRASETDRGTSGGALPTITRPTDPVRRPQAYVQGDPNLTREERLALWAYPAASGVVGTPAHTYRQEALAAWAWPSASTTIGTPAYEAVHPTAPTGGGGGVGSGGGGAVGTPDVNWSVGYEVEGAPSWWRGYIPSAWTPESEYAAMMNAMIPFLSWEDKQAVARNLATLFPQGFGDYTSANFTLPPPLDTAQIEKLRAARRGTRALDALEKLRSAAGRPASEFGPGYSYLRNVAKVVENYGGQVGADTRQTRAQYIQQLAQLDPLLAAGQSGDLSAFGPLARMLGTPFVSGQRPLVPVRRTQDGQYVFGSWNPFFG